MPWAGPTPKAVIVATMPVAPTRPWPTQHLAFWTGKDAARIERLMRRSALVREKWDRDDYLGPRTIMGAISRQVQVLQDKRPEPVALAGAGRLKILTSAEMLALPPMSWRVRDVLPEFGLAAIYGPSGSGKSFLVLDLAAALAGGVDWFGHRVVASSVLYCALEGQAGIGGRVRALAKKWPQGLPSDLRFMGDRFDLRTDALDLVAAIRDAGGADVVFIDTQNRAAPGMDENASSDMGKVIDNAAMIQEAIGGLVVLVTHTGKDPTKGERGHSSLRAAMDVSIEVTRTERGRNWSTPKVKDGADDDVTPFVLQVVPLSLDEDGSPVTSCVVSSVVGSATAPPRRPTGGNQKVAFDKLMAMLKGSDDMGKGGAPAHTRCVSFDQAVDEIAPHVPVDVKRRPERAKVALRSLISKFSVRYFDGWLWYPDLPETG